MGDQPQRLIPQGELGVAEEGLVGGGDELSGHLQDGVGASGLDARGQFLRAGFEFGIEWFVHDDLRPE
jgi:hypothetical protein